MNDYTSVKFMGCGLCLCQISMNVRTIHITVTLTGTAPIQTARSTAPAKSVTLAMESTVQVTTPSCTSF